MCSDHQVFLIQSVDLISESHVSSFVNKTMETMADDQKPEKKTFKTITYSFLGRTALHGLPHIGARNHIIVKIMWFLIFGAGITALTLQVREHFRIYYAYPIQTTVSLKTADALDFPAVTMCNINPVQRSLLKCTQLEQLIELDEKASAPVAANYYKEFPENNTGTEHRHDAIYLDLKTELPWDCEKILSDKREELQHYSGINQQEEKHELEGKDCERMDYLTCQMHRNNTIRKGGYTANLFGNFNFTNQSTSDLNVEETEWNEEEHEESESHVYANEQEVFTNMDLKAIEKAENVYEILLGHGSTSDLSDLNDLVQLSEEEIYWFGYTAEDFILECSFDRTPCYPENFTATYNPRYGNCYTFNSGINNSDVSKTAPLFRTRKYGSQNGLRITLNINASEYVGLLAPTYGARILIHQPRSYPYPELDGYDAAPGMMTAFGLTHVGVDRLPYPYESDCIDDYPAYLIPLTRAHAPYDMRSCQLACQDYHMINICNCTEYVPFLNKTKEMEYERCHTLVARERACRNHVMARLALSKKHKKALSCNCRPSCEDVTYRRAVSQSRWPSEMYQKMRINNFYGLGDPLSNLLAKYKTYDQSMGFVEKNLVRLQFFYQELNYEMIQEKPAYSEGDLFANVGGIIGLWVGLSACAVFEVFFFFIEIICHFIKTGLCGCKPEPEVPDPYYNGGEMPVKKFSNPNPPRIMYNDNIGPPGSYYY